MEILVFFMFGAYTLGWWVVFWMCPTAISIRGGRGTFPLEGQKQHKTFMGRGEGREHAFLKVHLDHLLQSFGVVVVSVSHTR